MYSASLVLCEQPHVCTCTRPCVGTWLLTGSSTGVTVGAEAVEQQPPPDCSSSEQQEDLFSSLPHDVLGALSLFAFSPMQAQSAPHPASSLDGSDAGFDAGSGTDVFLV